MLLIPLSHSISFVPILNVLLSCLFAGKSPENNHQHTTKSYDSGTRQKRVRFMFGLCADSQITPYCLLLSPKGFLINNFWLAFVKPCSTDYAFRITPVIVFHLPFQAACKYIRTSALSHLKVESALDRATASVKDY